MCLRALDNFFLERVTMFFWNQTFYESGIWYVASWFTSQMCSFNKNLETATKTTNY